MSLFKPKVTNWDQINGLRDLAGEKDTEQRYITPFTEKGNIGNPSKVEPFIWTDLPPLEDAWSGKEETDFLLRNGTLKDSATDVHRITRLLTETTRGKLFPVKQNLLSRSGVATEASGILNEGIYLPTSTLAQVGVVGLGGHLNKQGVNPFRKTGEVDNPDDGNTILGFDVTNPLGLPAYAQVVRGDQKTGENRLVGYFNNKINRTQKPSNSTIPSFTDKLKNRFIKLDGPNILDSYSGGPGSVLGVGRTIIRMSPEQRTGKNNVILNDSGFFAQESYNDYSVFKRPSSLLIKGAQIFNQKGSLSRKYEELTKVSTDLIGKVTTTNEVGPLQIFQNSVYKDNNGSITLDTNQDIANPLKSLSSTLTQEQLREQPPNFSSKIGPDFRKSLTKQPNQTISNSLDYLTQDIVNRVGVGDPGQRGNISDYQIGKRAPGDTNSTPVDKITSLPLYRSTTPTTSPDKNDLVKFRIASVSSSDPSNSVYIHFRAFLGSFSDSYNSSWSSQKLMGRALVKLTVGGYLYEQYGFIESLTLNIPENSPWEVALAGANKKDNSSEEIEGGEGRRHDTSVKELPHIIEASLSFKPIHNFVVRKQNNSYKGVSLGKAGRILSKYGLQQYIALSTSTSNASGYDVERTEPKNTGQKIK
mgnify:CR=1 FL=1